MLSDRHLNSFKVLSKGKLLDYRLGEKLDLDEVKTFFLKKGYDVEKIYNGNRHVVGVLTKDGHPFFLKLSTSEGMGVVTQNEFKWNNYFNKYSKEGSYSVPKNYGSGFYKKRFFYLITNYLDGRLLCDIYENADNLIKYIPQIIEFSETIQKLPCKEGNCQVQFLNKARAWFDDIPSGVRKEYNLKKLIEIVEKGAGDLSGKSRHGDFTPWHIIKLKNSSLGLIDGEHFLVNGVEAYDICYFIQRVSGVLKNSKLAQRIFSLLINKRYETNKLKTVLASRAIGGFLDESLNSRPDYFFAQGFANWVLEI